MISQSLYQTLSMCFEIVRPTDSKIENEVGHFLKPYVLIIHRPSGRGFYLDRDYRHIIDVASCQEPKNPVIVTRQHLGACRNMPNWAMVEKLKEFDTFWLYLGET